MEPLEPPLDPPLYTHAVATHAHVPGHCMHYNNGMCILLLSMLVSYH